METTFTAPRTAFEAWRSQNVNRYGSAIKAAFLDGYRAGSPWLNLTVEQRENHRAECVDLCLACEAFRARGFCRSCGVDKEADDQGRCVFCQGELLMATPDAREERSYWNEG